MFSIIVGFPRIEDAICIKGLLTRGGYNVVGACSSGAQIISLANELDSGIVVCGYRFSDMHYSELNNFLPKGFEMLLVASPEKLVYCRDNGIVCLPMPIKAMDLYNTLQMMTYQYRRRRKSEDAKPRPRSPEEKAVIDKAKVVLMERNNMTEEEAHRYLQKASMDSGTNMVEMAEIVLRLMY